MNGEPYFVGTGAQIGVGKLGMKPIAQNGQVVITQDGVLSLIGTKGDVLASAPVSTVEAKPVRLTWGQTLALTVDGTRYSVTLNSRYSRLKGGDMRALSNASTAAASQVGAKGLLEAIEAFQGSN
jgi:hypothetical protein